MGTVEAGSEKGSIKLTLSASVKFGEETIAEINFRAPTAKEFRKWSCSPRNFGDLLDIAQSVADQPPSFFDKIDPQDLGLVVGIGGNFLDRFLGTGSML